MERKTLVTVLIAVGVFLLWQHYFSKPTATAPAHRQEISKTTQGISVQTAKEQASQLQPLEASVLQGKIMFGAGADLLSDWVLNDFFVGKVKTDQRNVRLQSVVNSTAGSVRLGFDAEDFLYLNNVVGNLKDTGNSVAWTFEDEKVRLRREAIIDQKQRFIDVTISADFKASTPKFGFVSIVAERPSEDNELDHGYGFLGVYADKGVQRISLNDAVEKKGIDLPTKWIAVISHYFTLAVVNRAEFLPTSVVQPVGISGGRVSMTYPVKEGTLRIPLRIYFGPQSLELLKAVDPSLDPIVDFGWFEFIAYPLLQLMKWLNKFINNYGIVIIIVTLLLRVATYPLTYKSMKSSKKMAALQPQINKLREKHKDNPQRLNQEMMSFMKTQGYNPAAGCVPILLQLPFFIGFYNVLRNSVELYRAPFGLWIHDLSLKDPYYVTPVLLTLLMFLQQKMTPMPNTDPTQARVMQFMPVIFGVMMISLPAGLNIYMLVSTAAGIVQQLLMNKKLRVETVPTVAARAR